jgi:hypothetical protein
MGKWVEDDLARFEAEEGERYRGMDRVFAHERTIPVLPDGWRLVQLTELYNGWYAMLEYVAGRRKKRFSRSNEYPEGRFPNPRAALLSAIKNIGDDL